MEVVSVGPAAKYRRKEDEEGSTLLCRVCLKELPGKYIYDAHAWREYVHDECVNHPINPAFLANIVKGKEPKPIDLRSVPEMVAEACRQARRSYVDSFDSVVITIVNDDDAERVGPHFSYLLMYFPAQKQTIRVDFREEITNER